MQAAYVFSVLLSTGNSLPLDVEDFGEYNNLLFSRCVKIQVSLDSKYAYFGFGVFFVVGQAGFQLCARSVSGILCCARKKAKSPS